MHPTNTQVRRAAVLAAAMALATSGCGGTGGGRADANASADPPGCELLIADIGPGEADGALVVMLDGTISSAAETERVADVVALVDSATVEEEIAISIGSFGGSDDEVRYSQCLDGQVFVPDGNNARTRERNRPALVEALTAEITALPGGYEASDPTSALRAGISRLADVEGSRLLVIHTDGIATAGCAALPDEVNLSEPGLIEQRTEACANAGQIPTAVDGVEIVMGGIGRTDADLSAEAVTFLIGLNTALCEATGASCRVDPNLPTDA